MKKNNLTRSAFAVLLLSSTVVSADQQYPAADFKPEVIYQNNELIAKSSSAPAAKVTGASAHDAQYPAADFKPEVIYQNNDLIAKGSSATPAKSAPVAKAASEESVHDAQYPAANFKPEVLYVDANYKPSQISPKTSTAKEKVSSSTVEAEESTVVAAPKAEKESSSLVYLFGLVALGLAGFYLFKKPTLKSAEKPAAAPVTVQKSYALNTGVAKYLNKITGTGVSRYIESNIKAASAVKATGVAKYVAKQAANPTVAKAATGVDKYVRNRG